ncbi:uncharacterized protein DNG_01081 [Cephalotrichum gorgonifer]|uniref:Pre-mRNA splicing factor CLF1 n=1 Tax=Cephalotrichum gorgonifer TaxID=2041049 RepID=A0AAE8MQD9_9PEZI|nr:uncharacterized protein DNG_01081 [Cephalotrichum gorgonifer]
MTVPKPPVPLDDVCAVVHGNILYTYSSTGLLRLELKPNAEWEKLSGGVPVTGGVCVGSTPKDPNDAGLYIVGGVAANDEYLGIQKFTYSTGKWELVNADPVQMKGRQGHGATYINSTDSILVYSGNLNGAQGPSPETFLIHAKAPFEFESLPSGGLLAKSPLILPWSDSQAMVVGGGTEDRRVLLFDASTKTWSESGATMAEPIPRDSTFTKGVVMDGDDGSKSLYTFDMTKTPIEVRRVPLFDGDGKPIQWSPVVAARHDVGLITRQSDTDTDTNTQPLTLDDWPKYDNTLAPKEARGNYAAAQSASGTVVFVGGSKDNTLDMFDPRENKWLDPSLAFEQERLGGLSASSTVSSSTSTATSTSTSSATASSPSGIAAGSSDDDSGSGLSSNTILGIVLGSILGLMVLLGLILFCVRRGKNKKLRSDGASSIEKGSMGMTPQVRPGASRGNFQGHYPQHSTDSYSSVAILMGKTNAQNNKSLGRHPSNGTNRSSMSSVFNREFKSTISKPIPQPQLGGFTPRQPSDKELEAGDRVTIFGPSLTGPAPPRPPRGSATLGVPSSRGAAAGGSSDPAERRSSGWNRYWSGGSALNILGFGNGKRGSDQSSRYSGTPMNRVTQDSATVPALYVEPFEGRPELNRVNSGSPTVAQYPPRMEGVAGKIERPVSQASSGYSSGIPESIVEMWPQTQTKKPWGSDRARSSAYGQPQPSSLDPSSTAADPHLGVSKQPPLATAKTSTDMSWLNLAANAR